MTEAKKPAAEPEPAGGMFEKDKEIGLRIDTEFDLREAFILWDAAVAPELVDTAIGKARKTLLEVSRLDEPDVRLACSTLASAIADKAEQATPDDFPAVVELRKVASNYGNDALVIQYVRDYKS
jgi:hypothetical protein